MVIVTSMSECPTISRTTCGGAPRSKTGALRTYVSDRETVPCPGQRPGGSGISSGAGCPVPWQLAFDATHRLGGGAADHLGVAVGGVVTLPGKLSTTHTPD